jgi:hypothetical protein
LLLVLVAVVPSSLIEVLLLLLVLVVVLLVVVLMDGSFGGLPLDGIFEYIIVVCSGVCVCVTILSTWSKRALFWHHPGLSY